MPDFLTLQFNQKMKNLESIFESDSGFDHKNITLKCDKVVPDQYLKAIEDGVTSEELETFTKSGLLIFKYRTQITIHGVFGELQKHYIGGYKNLFQNKNGSIGVKYGAIDESKRKRLAEKLRYAGFSYLRNSSDHCFEITKSVNKDNFEAVKAKFFGLKAMIDTSLYTGTLQIYRSYAFGVQYLVLRMHVSIIAEKNVDKLWKCLISQADIDAALEAKRIKDEAYSAQLAEAAKQAQAVKEKALASAAPDIEYLKANFRMCEKTDAPGTYLKVATDWQSNLVYEVKHVYKPKGAKLPRHNDTSYPTMQAALEHVGEERSWDSTFKGKVAGRFILDQPIVQAKVVVAPVVKAPAAHAKVVEQPAKAVATAGMRIVPYTPKSFAVVGDTYAHRAQLKEMGGMFSKWLKVDGANVPGWIFSLKRETAVRAWLLGSNPAPKVKSAKPKATKQGSQTSLPLNLEALVKAEVEKRLGSTAQAEAPAPVKEDSPCCKERIQRALAGEAVSASHWAMRHVLEFGLRPDDVKAGTGLWGKTRDGVSFGESERRACFWMLNSKSQAIDLVCNEDMPEWFRYDGSEELFWDIVNDFSGAGGKAALVEKCIALAESKMDMGDEFPF